MIRRRATSQSGAPTGRIRRPAPPVVEPPEPLPPTDPALPPPDPADPRRAPLWLKIAWGGAFTVVLVGLLWVLRPVFAVLAASAGLAYLLDPVADWLERRRLSREAAIGVIYVGGLVLFAVFILIFVPSFVRQWDDIQRGMADVGVDLYDRLVPVLAWASEMTGRDLSISKENLEALRSEAPALVQDNLPRIQALATEIGQELLTRGLGVINTAINLLLLPIFIFYLLRDWDRMVAAIHDLIPLQARPRVERVAREVDARLGAFVRGQITVCLALAVLYSIGLLIVGIDLAIPVGVLSGLLFIVPYLGTAVGIVLSIFLSIVKFGFDLHLLWVIIVFVVVQGIEGYLLTPRIVGDRVGLHPLVVMVALIAGGGLLGIWGMLLAIPITAVITVIGSEWLQMYRSSRVYGVTGPPQPAQEPDGPA